jgi:hypothetical protein
MHTGIATVKVCVDEGEKRSPKRLVPNYALRTSLWGEILSIKVSCSGKCNCLQAYLAQKKETKRSEGPVPFPERPQAALDK